MDVWWWNNDLLTHKSPLVRVQSHRGASAKSANTNNGGGGISYPIKHYNDVTMGAIASQIISLAIVYSTVYSDADQRKHQSSASLAFVWGIHRDRWIPRTKSQLRGKCFHLMTSSCVAVFHMTVFLKICIICSPVRARYGVFWWL